MRTAADGVAASSDKRLLVPFSETPLSPPPIWLMRQAGRFLPEYRAVRARVGRFLDLCYTPELAAEVTLQPVRRFGLDAAIVFSDILVVPDALGQEVNFHDGEGPRLDPIGSTAELRRLDPGSTEPKFSSVWQTVTRVRDELAPEVALIGFCGGPWTVATYMVGGGGSSDQAAARLWAYRDPAGFTRLIEMLVDASVDYLCGQVRAGANVVQIFDSWAGALPEGEFRAWVTAPTCRLVSELKRRQPGIPVIGFPRGAGAKAADYVTETGVDGIGCDTVMTLAEMSRIARATGAVVQGNLDPLLLVAGGDAMAAQVRAILDALRGVPFIFNLGHGVLPETSPEHVTRLVGLVRGTGV